MSMFASRTVVFAAAFLATALPSPARAQSADDWARLEAQDLRLAAVAERLQGANALLCNALMPLTGLILHSADQYGTASSNERFRNSPLAIASLLPGSPAALAGLAPDDGVVAIDGVPVADIAPETGQRLREAAFYRMAGRTSAAPLTLTVARDGAQRQVVLDAPQGCRSLVEVLLGDGPMARSDGKVIQVQYDTVERLSDAHLAVVVAHELAHTVLEHRRRKEAAGIDSGLLAELGRNQRANREAEIEADRLAVHLLANAGYDPATMPDFFRNAPTLGIRGLALPSFVYPSPEARAELVERELALYLPSHRGPSWPGHLLARRDVAFSAAD
ncbi:PDZ domain-containing protein [Aurantiacibacter luteus]|uniref:PDZ domain-containing protein n=1 Tax=Aurantiacibacter luteus TaxID=1581420 RepID=UPI00069A2C02|nr:M48 family metallopeptidase [Aurantiacibacter luteus]